MSVIASTAQQICNSPLNNSRSKMLFSFPKSKKIADVRKSDCTNAFYDLPGIRAKRTTSFGYGHKYDFTKAHTKTPAPNAYENKSIFDEQNKKKGFSFGLSREAMAVTGGQLVGDKKSPGPGAYDIRGINKTNIAFSFRPRTTIDNMNSFKHVPGPGAYSTIDTINLKGKYSTSKFKNSGASIIAPARSQRWNDKKAANEPGPGAYDLKTGINMSGSYFVSKFKSNIARSFGNAVRKDPPTTNLTVPGPGSYRVPSEFGYYESMSSHKTLPKMSQSTQSLPTQKDNKD